MSDSTSSKRDSIHSPPSPISKEDPSLTARLRSVELTGSSSHALSTTNTAQPSLITLPPQLRKRIYTHLLDTETLNVSLAPVSYTHSFSGGVLQFHASRPPYPACTPLFLVNRQISTEALAFFYETNLWIRLEVHTTEARRAKTLLTDSGILFCVSRLEEVERVTRHAMDVSIVEIGQNEGAEKRAVVMFPAQYLPRLVNYLELASRTTKTWASGFEVGLKVVNLYGFGAARVQGDLLEGFRRLHGFGGAKIEGVGLLPRYAEKLQESMMAETFSAQTFLDTVTDIADSMEEALGLGLWERAAQHAQSGIIAMTYGFLTRGEELHTQAEGFVKGIQRARWRCELGSGRAVLELHKRDPFEKDWLSSSSTLAQEKRDVKREAAKAILAAETSGSQALSLATDSPNPASNPWFQSLPVELIPPNNVTWFTDVERAQTWYVCGLVHTLLDEYLFAAGDLERACGLDPSRREYEDAFRVAREGIDWSVKPGSGMKRAVQVARG